MASAGPYASLHLAPGGLGNTPVLIWLLTIHYTWPIQLLYIVKKGSPYLITKHRVPELILVLGSRLAGDVSHKPGDRLPLLSTRPAVTLAALIRAATSFTVW